MNKDSFNEEMFEEVPKYVNFVIEQYEDARKRSRDAIIEIERKVDFSDWVPEGFGLCDTNIVADGILDVTDLKYGKGLAVYADDNSQLKLYGLGALRLYEMSYDIHTVRLNIVQPRINNYSSWEISVDDLYVWADNYLKETANEAWNGDGELTPGDWCRFCRVKGRCTALAKENLELARMEFAEPALLTDEEISEVLEKAPRLVEWANSVRAYAMQQSINHDKVWPGFKLVEGASRRKWIDEKLVVNAIKKNLPGLESEDIYDLKLKSLTAIEKKIGKKEFHEKLGHVVIKPQGAPTLVSDDDKRPAMGLQQAMVDFKDDYVE